jgi:hypothetical protein
VPEPRPVVLTLALVALAAPFAGVAYGAASLVGPLSRAAAAALAGVVAPLASARAEAAVSGEPQAPLPPAPLPEAAATSKSSARRGASVTRSPVKPQALFVSGQTVLKLAASAARPRGAFVPGTSEHPAGLRLSGVGALGIGVQDGDILIEALGIAPREPGEIIGAVLKARANNARFLSGTLWRGGDTFRITVEQPYLPAQG